MIGTVAAVVTIVTGVLTLWTTVFSSPAVVIAPGESKSQVPRFVGMAGHFQGSAGILDFLESHDGDAVKLGVAFDIPRHDFNLDPTRTPGKWIQLYQSCLDLPEGEDPSVLYGCSGTQLLVQGRETTDSKMAYSQFVRLNGYFSVDVATELHQGIATVKLTPLTFEDAKGS